MRDNLGARLDTDIQSKNNYFSVEMNTSDHRLIVALAQLKIRIDRGDEHLLPDRLEIHVKTIQPTP